MHDDNFNASQVKRKSAPERLAYMRARHKADPERHRAKAAAYRQANPDKVKAYLAASSVKIKAVNAIWRSANAERLRTASADWAKANPEVRRIQEHNRRAKTRENGGTLSKYLSADLFKSQRGLCVCCNLPLGDDYQLDHKMPVALGGRNADDNMQLLRKICNLQKNKKHPIDFMQSRGFLL